VTDHSKPQGVGAMAGEVLARVPARRGTGPLNPKKPRREVAGSRIRWTLF
jgi:hypothetical protein